MAQHVIYLTEFFSVHSTTRSLYIGGAVFYKCQLGQVIWLCHKTVQIFSSLADFFVHLFYQLPRKKYENKFLTMAGDWYFSPSSSVDFASCF